MEEVEIRGGLDKDKADKLRSFLEEKGKFEKSFKRLSVEISPGFEAQTRSWSQHDLMLRIKKSDEEEKISLKYGDIHSERVGECEVYIESGQFLVTLELFGKLGFDSGLIMYWQSWVFEYKGCEVKMTEFGKQEYMWEIEARGEDKKEAEKMVYDLAKALGLKVWSREEYKAEIKRQNNEVFEIYEIEKVREYLKNF